MGTEMWPVPELRLLSHRADLPAGAAGQVAQAARLGAGRRPDVEQRAGAYRGELGGGKGSSLRCETH